MEIKRFSFIMILLVFINLTNYAQDSSYIKKNNIIFRHLYVNFGASYSSLSTLSNAFNPENCLGYHFGIEIKKDIDKNLYWGIETNFEYFPTKFSEFYAEIDPDSFTGNMNVNYTYVNVVPKIGIHWKPIKLKWYQIFYTWPGLFNYTEFNLGFGRAFYNIDQLFNNETDNNRYYFDDSERLHSLNSEFIITAGIRVGRKISERISFYILLQGSAGLEQSKHYEAEWVNYGVFEEWIEEHTHRMTEKSVVFCFTYRLF